MQVELKTAFDWRADDTKAAIGKLSDVSQQWQKRARLSDGWALVLQPNGISDAQLDEEAAKFNALYEENSIAVSLLRMGHYVVMFGDLKGLSDRVMSGTLYAPGGYGFALDFVPELQKLQKSDRERK